MELEKLVTTEEAARILGVNSSTLRMRRMNGQPPAFIKLGKQHVYHLDELERVLPDIDKNRNRGPGKKRKQEAGHE